MASTNERTSRVQDLLTVRRVYGEAYEKDGVTFIPAAAVRGCGCGGEGDCGKMAGGTDTRFGMCARPVGAYQIRDNEVVWIPAADTTRVIVMGQVVTIVALLLVRSILRARRAKA